MFTTAIGVLAVCAGVARAWPQLVRIVVRRNAQGVSGGTWFLSLASFITWEAIALIENVAPALVYNVFGIASSAAVLAVLVWHKSMKWWVSIVGAALVIALNVAVYELVGALAVSTLGIVISMSMFLPQVIGVLRAPGVGVSPLTWWIAAFTSMLWGVYGVLIQEYVFSIPTIVMLPSALVILWKVRCVSGARLIAPVAPD